MKTPEEIAAAHALHRDAVVKLGPLHPLFAGSAAGDTRDENYLTAIVVEAVLEWVLGLPPRGKSNPVADTLPLIRAAVNEATAHERN